jgi:outer membrane protein assembly factor BamD (BamD/ComL family)
MIRPLLITSLIFFSVAAWAAQAERAIMGREANIYLSPDTSSQKIGQIGRGREVAIIDKTKGWVQVFANIEDQRDLTGWIIDKGVVHTSTPNGDQILFGEAVAAEREASSRGGRRGADREAMRLYARMAEYFPKSPLAAEALYRAADIRWQLESADVRTLPSAKERDPIFHQQINEDLMHEVIKKFPGTKWADLAAFHLIDNKLCGDWQGLPKCPEKETEIYEKYAKEHPNSPARPQALYQAAWRQAALVTIYKNNNENGKVAKAKANATALAQQIVTAYPQSDWGARAQSLIFLMDQGIPTYGPALE